MPNISAQPGQPTFINGVAAEDLNMIVEQAGTDVWQQLRGKRIFITGGTGFMGCWLLEALLWANQTLTLDLDLHVLSRQPDNFRRKAPHLADHRNVTLVKGNVTDLRFIDTAFDIVLHAATDVAAPAAAPSVNFEQIVLGTRETLALAERCKAENYLLVSSGAIYGQQPVFLSHIPEDYQGAPDTLDIKSAYGQAKRVSEWLAICTANGPKVSIARCFALLGPYLPLDAQFAAGNFIRDALLKRPIHVKGDGTPHRSYLYAADMVVWLLKIMLQGSNGQAYNLGAEQGITITDLAREISGLIGNNTAITLEKTAAPGASPQKYIPSTEKARSELGLDEYTKLADAIRKTADWASASPSATLAQWSHAES